MIESESNADTAETPGSIQPPRGRRRRIILSGLLAAVLIPVSSCGFMGRHMAEREARNARRTPEGIMIGAEPRDLGPADSPRAALFVHGFIGGGSNFNTLPDRLAAEGWHVRVMRLPGCGTSPVECAETSAETMTKAVEDELRALRAKHEHVALVTHSMGGALGVVAAQKEPVDALVLGAPYFGVTYKWYYILPLEKWGSVAGWALPWTYKGKLFMQIKRKGVKDKIFSYGWVPTAAARELFKLGDMANDPARLAAIKCPVLMLHGPNDHAASYERATAAYNRIGSEKKEFVVLPESNHIIYWDVEDEMVAREALSFLGRSVPAGSSPTKAMNSSDSASSSSMKP